MLFYMLSQQSTICAILMKLINNYDEIQLIYNVEFGIVSSGFKDTEESWPKTIDFK